MRQYRTEASGCVDHVVTSSRRVGLRATDITVGVMDIRVREIRLGGRDIRVRLELRILRLGVTDIRLGARDITRFEH